MSIIGDIFSDVIGAVVGIFTPSIPNIPEVVSHVDIQQQLEPDYNVPVLYGEAGTAGNIIFYQRLEMRRIRLMLKRIEWSGTVYGDNHEVVIFNNLIQKQKCLLCENDRKESHEEGCFMGDLNNA